MMPGRASGVWRAALWKRMMDPGWTLDVTRWVISLADRSFQSRLSLLETAESRWETLDYRFVAASKIFACRLFS